jgi:hypothetical protein
MSPTIKIVTVLGAAVALAIALRVVAGPTAVIGTGAIYAVANVPGAVQVAVSDATTSPFAD